MASKRIVTCLRCGGTGEEIKDSQMGRWLARQRAKEGISLRALAAECGMSHVYLSDLEHGRRRWSQRLVLLFTKRFKQNQKEPT